MTAPHVAVVGSGSLARSICYSLAGFGPADPRRVARPGDPLGAPDPAAPGRRPIRVSVLARNAAAVTEIVRLSRVRATVSGARLAFAGEPLAADTFGTDTFGTDTLRPDTLRPDTLRPDTLRPDTLRADTLRPDTLGPEARALGRLRPDVLVCCASTQSPYERTTAPSRWTSLVEQAGFGITLPLQAGPVARLARVLARVSPDTLLLNGCFPDAVNPLLAALDLPVLCGIGNVATIAACLRSTMDLPGRSSLAVLGHHVHLAAPDDPADEVRAWADGKPVDGVTDRLAGYRALPRREINAIAGHAAARLVLDLVADAEIRTSVPGPLGLPGGYPVRIAGREISLDLPAGLDADDAVAWNTRVGRRDGVIVHGGRVSYPISVAATLAEHVPTMATGWAAADLDAVADRLATLRHRLRLAPPVPVGPAP